MSGVDQINQDIKTHGGKREGAGRVAGTPNKATVELAKATATALEDLTPEQIEAMSPRDVMRLVMITGLKAGDLKVAFTAASELAPYYHPKLSAVALDATIKRDPRTLTDADLAAIILDSGEGTAAP